MSSGGRRKEIWGALQKKNPVGKETLPLIPSYRMGNQGRYDESFYWCFMPVCLLPDHCTNAVMSS